jgi:hypothetical protein
MKISKAFIKDCDADHDVHGLELGSVGKRGRYGKRKVTWIESKSNPA